jgi:DNA-binding CsgD family transcriptional regulator
MIMLNDGRIIAGTNNGADIVIGENIQLNQDLPHLVFTKLSILNKEILPNIPFHERVVLTKSITYTNELVLTWKDKAFTLEFAALNYTLPEKCLYKYKLEGFDDDWVHTGADRRIVNYSNLAAGVYTLKILASNNDGKWGENELVLKIVVKPPFWNTLVFKLLIAFLLTLLIYYSYKQRIKAHEKQYMQKQLEQERKIIALENENLEAELKKLAFSIISKNKLLVEQKNRILNLSNKARESVKEGMQKIVDYIDEELDEEKDWNFIEPQIDKAYNHFITRLKENHPDLNSNEIRIAAYIRMNLSTKEICEFMNKTQRAVENDRYRLRKKIGLESNDNIKAYLENL